MKKFLIILVSLIFLAGCEDLEKTAGPPSPPPPPLITSGQVASPSGDTSKVTVTPDSIYDIAVAVAGEGTVEVEDEAFTAGNFNADETHAVSQDDFYDRMHLFDTDDDGSFADETWLTTYMTEAEFTSTIGAAYDTSGELDTLFAGKQDADAFLTDIANLTDPDADVFLFWDDSAGDIVFLTLGSGLSIVGTEVTATGSDAFTVKVDAGATAGYLGAANSDGVLRTDGSILTYTDGGDFVTLGVHAYLADIAGITAAQGDVIYFDGTDFVNLGPGTDGYFLKTQGAGANPIWAAPPGGGDITAVGDCANGDCFVDGSASTTLTFEGTDNAYETLLTATDPTADATVTIPNETGDIALSPGAGFAADNVLPKTDGTGNLLQATGITVDDSNNMSNIGTIGSGAITSSGVVTATGFTIGSAAILEAELEILDGATTATADLNIIDGISDTGSLTAAELLYVDGVTSSIQTQLDARALESVVGTSLNADDLELDGTALQLAAEIPHTDVNETITGNWTFSGTIAANGEVTMGADLNLNANEIQSTSNVVVQLGDNAGTNVFEIEDSDGNTIFTVNSDGKQSLAAVNDPYILFDDNDEATEWALKYSDTNNRLMVGSVTGGDAVNNFTEVGYWHADGMYYAGNVNISTGHTYQINGSQINIGNLAAGGNWTPTGTINLDSATLTLNSDALTVDNGTNYSEFGDADDDTIDELFDAVDTALAASAAGTLSALTDTTITTPSSAQVLIYDGSDSWDNKTIGGDATLANDGALTIAANAVENSMMADNSVDSAEIVAGAVDPAHAASGAWDFGTSVEADTITEGGVGVINTGETEVIDSDMYVDASIDPAHVASGAWDFGTSVEADTLTEGGNAVWNDADTDVVDDTHLNWASMTYLGEEGQPTAAAVGLASDNLDDTDASIEWEDAADLESDGAISDNAVDYSATAGSVKALTPVVDAAADFAANFTGANLYGGTFVCDTTGTIQLPAVAAGMNFTIITKGAIAVVVEPNASDMMMLDGTDLDDADSATNLSTAGDIIVFQYMSAAGWIATSNGWTDED
jgi:hypothetical protein